MSANPLQYHLDEIAKDLAMFYDDPLGFVMWSFPWGVPGTQLEKHSGPRDWQREQLQRIGAEVRSRGFDGKTPVAPVQTSTTSGHGIGKANCVSTLIPTPSGMRRHGDIKVGDFVYGADGKPTKVIQVKHYRDIDLYRVVFDDRSDVVCSSGHLWNVRGRQERRKGDHDTWRTLGTLEILEKGVKRPNGKSEARQWEIPVQGSFEYESDVPLHPYVFGLWLGDGSKGSPGYSKPYVEIREKVRGLGFDAEFDGNGMRVYIKGVRDKYNETGVFHLGSHERYIPSNYKFTSVENRRHLLEGLCDSDGETHKSGSVGYSTSSKALAEDIIWLARSLGCKATLQPTVKKPFFPGADGKKKQGRDNYRVTINMPWNPFTLEHRKVAFKPSEARYTKRWVESIEYEGKGDANCLTVENEDGLYLTKDFLVTHNSCYTSWLILWIMATRPFCKGTVSANTADQLRTKTWAELSKWHNMFLVKDLFTLHSTRGNMCIFNNEYPQTWRCDAQTCREENSESFAGQHAENSTSFYIFDEASAIPEKIFQVAMGGLTDGAPQIHLFGNPTRNSGYFWETFSGEVSKRWINYAVDSRTVPGAINVELTKQWAEDYGEDSDFFKVRVKGEFPSAASNQLIGTDAVDAATAKHLPVTQYRHAPVILGVDVARFGEDKSCIYKRQGLFAEKLAEFRSLDLMTLAARVAQFEDEHEANAVFIDVGMGAGVIDRLRQLGRNPIEVNFGAKSTDKRCKNKRSEMWWKLKKWLESGGSIPQDRDLRKDLISQMYLFDVNEKLMLVKKEDLKKLGLQSPDDGDALALTFAEDVRGRKKQDDLLHLRLTRKANKVKTDYDLWR
jgi:hypothetical protein